MLLPSLITHHHGPTYFALGVRMPCTSCVLPGRLAEQLSVRPEFLSALIAAGKLATHDHGVATITKDAADDLRWRIAEHRAGEAEAA